MEIESKNEMNLICGRFEKLHNIERTIIAEYKEKCDKKWHHRPFDCEKLEKQIRELKTCLASNYHEKRSIGKRIKEITGSYLSVGAIVSKMERFIDGQKRSY